MPGQSPETSIEEFKVVSRLQQAAAKKKETYIAEIARLLFPMSNVVNPENAGKLSVDNQLFILFEQTVPNGLDMVELTRASNTDEFTTALQQRQKEQIADFKPVYTANIRIDKQQLERLKQTIESLEEPALSLYRLKWGEVQRNINLLENLGKPEFTQFQNSPATWGQIIDIEQSLSQGETFLKGEAAAKALLERDPSTANLPYQNLGEFVTWMHLSNEELAHLEFTESDLEKTDIVFDATKFQKLMHIYLHRLGITDWRIQISEKAKTINVKPREKVIEIPEKRKEDLLAVVICAHEVGAHALRAENGSKQKIELWRIGEVGYDSTEEGMATFMEMLMGVPYGHPRQREFAARYYAIAMALKTKLVDGVTQAKYSSTEIFEQLVKYQISEKNAALIVWRIFRGTSFKQQIVEIKVQEEEKTVTLLIPEVFIKDTIYFRGMTEIFTWIKKKLPFIAAHSTRRGEILEFNSFELKLLGLSLRRFLNQKYPPEEWLRINGDNGPKMEDLGREFLYRVYDFFACGKLAMSTLLDPVMQSFIDRESTVSIRKLFQPLDQKE